RLGVDDVNRPIGTIGEIIRMSSLIDPADVEGVHSAGCVIGWAHGDRDRFEQPYRPSIRLSLVLSLIAPRGIPAPEQDRSDRSRQSREPEISLGLSTGKGGKHDLQLSIHSGLPFYSVNSHH